jgi:formylglycine-generating enzyme required for sulfatase activity
MTVRWVLLALPLAACTGRALPGSGPDGAGASEPTLPLDLGPPADIRPPADLASPGWVTVKPGTFLMGSPEEEPCRLPNEERHAVTLNRAFEIGASEVTQGEFLQLMGYNPSHFSGCGSGCPADSVDWSAAAVYSNRLSKQAGLTPCYICVSNPGGDYAFPFDCAPRAEYLASIYECPGYRLPTEAEWERAYRAGTTTALSDGPIGSCDDDAKASAIGWYSANAGGQPHEVAGRKPNAWGLYDMAGNLWEWVNDWYKPDLGADPVTDPGGPTSGQGKVLRGGAWVTGAGSVRAASRNQNQRFKGLSFVGFRLARTVGP